MSDNRASAYLIDIDGVVPKDEAALPGARSPFHVGKPSAFMMRAGLRHMDAHSAEACMVGDNMETDIIAGVQTGMTTVLVLTGVPREADLDRFPHRPDHVAKDAFALRELLERGVRHPSAPPTGRAHEGSREPC